MAYKIVVIIVVSKLSLERLFLFYRSLFYQRIKETTTQWIDTSCFLWNSSFWNYIPIKHLCKKQQLSVHIVLVLKTRQKKIQQARIYNKPMVSFNNTGGDTVTKPGATTSLAAAKKKQPTSGIKTVTLKGDAKVESILHLKVIKNKSGQSGQIIALVGVLSSYCGDKQFPDWPESIKNDIRKD